MQTSSPLTLPRFAPPVPSLAALRTRLGLGAILLVAVLRQRFGHLALAAVVLLAVTFLWVGIVDATPASQRPYVGSSQDNSEISLAFGYNGVQRLLGLFGRGSAFSGGNANAGAGFFAGETGAPGPLHLFSTALGGQAGWLLPIAVAITGVLGVSVASMLLVPAAWSYATATRGGQGMMPTAGPSPLMTFTINGKTYILSRGMGGGFGNVNSANTALIAYLEAHRDGAKSLMATFNAQSAAPIILATGQPVMAIGGFSGGDPILTTTQFAALVAQGQVRFVMLQGAGGNGRRHFGDLPEGFPGGGFPGGNFPGGFRERPDRPAGGFGGFMGGQANAALMQWVQQNCKIVPTASYGGTTNSGMFAGQLYQCGTQGTLAQTH